MTDGMLTRRQGRPPQGGPYEGVPKHLLEPLLHWVSSVIWDHGNLRYKTEIWSRLMAAEQIPTPSTGDAADRPYLWVMSYCLENDDQFLDVCHALLQLKPTSSLRLDSLLTLGGSVWTAERDAGLVRRVGATARKAYEQATAVEDLASAELSEAWLRAYGRHADPSDAWDHAIKAVEAVLIPIVVPTQTGAHMGHVVGQLDRQGGKWDTLLRFNQTRPPDNPPHNSVQALVGAVRLIYPNPDRHVGPEHRMPSLDEARAVVHLAVTIVQWGRAGVIRRSGAT